MNKEITEEDLHLYLDRMREFLIKEHHKDVVPRARMCWRRLKEEVPYLEIPQVGLTMKCGISFVWDVDDYHFEVDILIADRFEVFYRNRKTEKLFFDESVNEDFIAILKEVFDIKQSANKVRAIFDKVYDDLEKKGKLK